MANYRAISFICLLCWLSDAVQSRPCTGIACLIGCPTPPPLDDCIPNTTRYSFTIGEVVQYRCRRCCTYARGSSTSICLTTGFWQTPTLRCTCKTSRSAWRNARSSHEGICGEPPTAGPMEKRLDSDGIGCSGSTVNFVCAQGYTHIGGSKTYKCTRIGMWEEINNDMTCRELTCKRETLPNGQVIPLDKISFHHKENVTLRCFENYRLVGDVIRTCQNGAWSGNPTKCIALKCQPPPSPSFGSFYPKSQYEVGESVSYTCNDGYTLVGNHSRICRDDETWSEEVPVCQVIDCENPVNSRRNVTLLQGTTTYLSTIEIRCYDEPNKIYSASCNKMGMWAPHVDCPRNCTRPDVGFSTFSNGANWQEYTLHGNVGSVRCTSGVPMVCHNGTWKPEIRTCFKGRHCENPRTSGCQVNTTDLTDVMDAASFSSNRCNVNVHQIWQQSQHYRQTLILKVLQRLQRIGSLQVDTSRSPQSSALSVRSGVRTPRASPPSHTSQEHGAGPSHGTEAINCLVNGPLKFNGPVFNVHCLFHTEVKFYQCSQTQKRFKPCTF